MTTGEILKERLGLEYLSEVKVSRFVISSFKTIGVFYDSYRDFLVTNYRVRRFPRVASIQDGTDLFHGENDYTLMTPLVDIEDYNGMIRGTLIMPVDLAGDNFIDEDQYSKVFESKEKEEPKPELYIPKNTLNEITLYDLADDSSISDFTQTWYKDRKRVMGSENTVAKLIDCVVDEADKSVTFQFLTTATSLDDKDTKNENPNDDIESAYKYYDGPKSEVDPGSFDLERNRAKTYELQIKIVDALEWIKAFEGEKIGRKEMKEILEVSDIKVFSTSPAFHYQGANFNASQIDASIYPTSISNPVWGPRHGDKSGYFLGKHLYSLLQSIDFWLNPMSSMLTGKLRGRGLI